MESACTKIAGIFGADCPYTLLKGAISEGEWNSFSGMCSEESDFMAQLIGTCSLPNEVPNGTHHAVSTFWPSHDSNINIAVFDESSMYSSEETNSSMYSFSQRSSYSGGSSVPFPSPSHESYYPIAPHQFFLTNNNSMTMEYGIMEINKNDSSRMHVVNNNGMEGDDFLNQDVSNDSVESYENLPEDALRGKHLQLGRETEPPMPETPKDDKVSRPSVISKKRPRIPVELPRSKRNPKLGKCLKNDDNDDENNNVSFHRQSSSSCISEGESNASHEQNVATSSSSGVPKSHGKARAGRGSASDPQSLYARKRREKINERLRILQGLVPNGTKVDISTMLEEAVEYVKFLQLQIKLLSSDDHWMYSPIAYNGMDIGLDLKISPPKSLT